MKKLTTTALGKSVALMNKSVNKMTGNKFDHHQDEFDCLNGDEEMLENKKYKNKGSS